MRKYLPNLRTLAVAGLPCKRFQLKNLGNLEELFLIDPQWVDSRDELRSTWKFELPNLRNLHLEFNPAHCTESPCAPVHVPLNPCIFDSIQNS